VLRVGDLVQLVDVDYAPALHRGMGRTFTVGNLDTDKSGFDVPMETLGVVVKVVLRPPDIEHDTDDSIAHVMVEVGGQTQVGWAYIDECRAVSDD